MQMIHEATFFSPRLKTCWALALHLDDGGASLTAQAKRLIMTHFSPRYAPGNDLEKDLLQEARAIFPNTEMAYDFRLWGTQQDGGKRSYPRQWTGKVPRGSQNHANWPTSLAPRPFPLQIKITSQQPAPNSRVDFAPSSPVSSCSSRATQVPNESTRRQVLGGAVLIVSTTVWHYSPAVVLFNAK